MYQKKRMRTFIITGEGIKKVLSVICIICIFAAAVGIIIKISNLPGPSAKVGINIISKSINDEEIDFEKWGNRILGFDLKDAKTIFYGYYSLFGETDSVEAAVESAPPEVQTAGKSEISVEEYNIEEVNAAKGMEVSNQSGLAVDANALANEPLRIKIDNAGPQVLIIHTHTTESFTDSGKTKYSSSDSDRSTDNTKNIVAVGEVIKNVLTEDGIETIHDTTVHDYPSYNGAYTRSMTTVQNNLQKYPSVKIVLDVHRDGIVRTDGTKVKVAADINGEKAAQCMFVVGTDAKLTHNNWRDNMQLACKLQRYANENFPGLMRPINLRKERFNQQVSNGAVIIEVGSNGNTLEEAKTGAKYMARTICAVLKGG